ncbi:AcrR family transcriptional regulator [Bradyrhizobium sp. USDA 4486]
MSEKGDSTREQIVTAATRLFYGEGIRAVSMDAVAEKAGVTKKTLYYHFTSKDELVAATIAARDQPTLELYKRWFAETNGTVADKVRGLFTKLGRSVDTPRCAAAAFCAPSPSSPTRRPIRRSRPALSTRSASKPGLRRS